MVSAIVLINCAKGVINQTAEALTALDGISEVYSVAGRVDLVAVIRVPDNDSLAQTVTDAMLNIPTTEYLKIYDAIYGFDLLNLAAITVPTLVLNGERESKAVFRHTDEMLKLIPNVQARMIIGAGHTSNLENPAAFNAEIERFLTIHKLT